MRDGVTRFLLEALDIRGAVVHLDTTWRSLQAGRAYGPAAAQLLGQLAGLAALLTAQAKSPGRLTFQMTGHGPVSMLLADCTPAEGELRLRGLAKAPAELALAPPAHLFADGRLAMTLDYGPGTTPYQSIVPVEGEDLVAVFEGFLAQSDQTATRLLLHATPDWVGGIFLQKLPGADQADPDGWNRVNHLLHTLKGEELGMPVETLLTRLFAEEQVRLFPLQPVRHHAPRDEAKILAMLESLGHEEVSAMMAQDGEIVIIDEIGNHEYRFGPSLLQQLFDHGGPTLH